MNPLKRLGSTITAVATMALVTTIVPQPAAAQQKTIVTPTLIRNIDEPGFNPFQFTQNVLWTNPSFYLSVPVPENKVLVVEHVSASGLLDPGGIVQGFLWCFNGTQEVHHSLVLTYQGTVNGWTQWAVSQPIKCYATTETVGSGGGLYIKLQTSTINSNQHTWVAAVSGYLVPR